MKYSVLLPAVLFLMASGALAAPPPEPSVPSIFKYTTIQYKGPSEEKLDLLFLGDGFTKYEQAKFNQRVEQAVWALRSFTPYGDRAMCWANIWRLNLWSQDSGVDHPKQGIYKNTALDCTYGDDVTQPERVILTRSMSKVFLAASDAPEADVICVLVNDEQWGGVSLQGSRTIFSSIYPGDQKHPGGFATIFTHELGHQIGGLADEYDCLYCNGTDDNRTYFGSEPFDVNLTTETARANIKWNDLILASTPVPTPQNHLPVDAVGLWEGGGYHRYHIYRPQRDCQMRRAADAFCAVCEREMRRLLYLHCADCAQEPLNPECVFIDWVRVLQLTAPRFKCKWPLPICPTCPSALLVDDIGCVIGGTPPGATLTVTDENGAMVATAMNATGGSLQLTFSANRAKQYFMEVASNQAGGGPVTLQSQLFRNGVPQPLPEVAP